MITDSHGINQSTQARQTAADPCASAFIRVRLFFEKSRELTISLSGARLGSLRALQIFIELPAKLSGSVAPRLQDVPESEVLSLPNVRLEIIECKLDAITCSGISRAAHRNLRLARQVCGRDVASASSTGRSGSLPARGSSRKRAPHAGERAPVSPPTRGQDVEPVDCVVRQPCLYSPGDGGENIDRHRRFITDGVGRYPPRPSHDARNAQAALPGGSFPRAQGRRSPHDLHNSTMGRCRLRT